MFDQPENMNISLNSADAQSVTFSINILCFINDGPGVFIIFHMFNCLPFDHEYFIYVSSPKNKCAYP